MQFPGSERLAVVSAGQEVDDLLVELQRALDRAVAEHYLLLAGADPQGCSGRPGLGADVTLGAMVTRMPVPQAAGRLEDF
jgi:hypothetical protein